MSLDLSNKTGCTVAGTVAAPLTSTFPVDADFAETMEDNAQAQVLLDTTAGDITITPAAYTGLTEGDVLMFVKTDTSANRIIYTDPVSGFVYNFVNRQGEYLCLKYDGTNWVVTG